MQRSLASIVAGLALAACLSGAALAQETIKFAMPQDFTAVYTFLTGEYNQGQRDYLTLVNEEGGIDGRRFEALVSDTGNQPQRGIEAYNRARDGGAILFDFLSTPVSRALVPQVLQDEVVMITPVHGRGDASDGQTFPYVFPVMATYWSQATVLANWIEEKGGGLQGKKIALVHIDSPFGREPIPVLTDLATEKNFELQTFAYASPGNEQGSTWTEVRRYRPDYAIIWGAGGGQAVSVREAVRNGIAADKILSVVWLSETDARTVGPEVMKGAKRFEAVAPGRDHPIIRRIDEKVVAKGLGAGDAAIVGTSQYNLGVATMAVAVEAARLALADGGGGELTGPRLKAGFERIANFDAEGLMPPITITPADHQGGGMGRVSEWNGEAWVPVTDWGAHFGEIVQREIDSGAQGFREGR